MRSDRHADNDPTGRLMERTTRGERAGPALRADLERGHIPGANYARCRNGALHRADPAALVTTGALRFVVSAGFFADADELGEGLAAALPGSGAVVQNILQRQTLGGAVINEFEFPGLDEAGDVRAGCVQ